MDRTSLVLVALVLFCVAHSSVGHQTTASPPPAKKVDDKDCGREPEVLMFFSVNGRRCERLLN